jgi:hypothetical protein
MFSKSLSQNYPDEGMCTCHHPFFNLITMTNFVTTLSLLDKQTFTKYTNTSDVAYQILCLLQTTTENTRALTVFKHAPDVVVMNQCYLAGLNKCFGGICFHINVFYKSACSISCPENGDCSLLETFVTANKTKRYRIPEPQTKSPPP